MTLRVESFLWSFWRSCDGGYGFSSAWKQNGVSLGPVPETLSDSDEAVRITRGPVTDDILLGEFNGKIDED